MPVLFLTARDQVETASAGVDRRPGVKPLAFSMFLARVRVRQARRLGSCWAADLIWCCAQPRFARRQCEVTAKGLHNSTAAAQSGRSAATLADRFAGVGHELRQRHQRHRGSPAPPARQGGRCLRAQADTHRVAAWAMCWRILSAALMLALSPDRAAHAAVHHGLGCRPAARWGGWWGRRSSATSRRTGPRRTHRQLQHAEHLIAGAERARSSNASHGAVGRGLLRTP